MNTIRILICGALFCASNWALSAEFTAKVIAVLDGDTVLIRREGGLVKIRLAEIDAPEKAQTFGETSKQSLAGMVLGKQVKVVSQAVDQYGRMVAHLSVDGLDVNAEQIRRGMAWEYSNFHSNKTLIALQTEAKQAPRGLWAQGNPTPPWEWRLRHVTDKTTSHSTRRANNTRQVAGYGEASRLRELPPAAHSAIEGLEPSELGRRKLHPSIKPGAVATSATNHAATPNAGCGNKKHCAEMSSCEEAKFYLTQCGVKSLDGDGDGTPCEALCAPLKSKN